MKDLPDIPDEEWAKATFEGAEMESIRAWRNMSFEDKLKVNEEMNEYANEIFAKRKARGLPCIDPDTGEVVKRRC